MKFLDKLDRQSFFPRNLKQENDRKKYFKKAALESNKSHLQNFEESLYQS